ncbi:thioredoxin-like protein [Sporodiniella umbellata]|nr:thioredoxin-like protein [Sporodiniella umbellata]
MEDALFTQFQNCNLDEIDSKRIESETDEEADKDTIETTNSTASSILRDQGPQTGPKGVQADYAFYQQKKTQKEQKARYDYNERLLAKAPMTTTFAQDQKEAELVLEGEQENDSSDEEMMQQYRERRLRELKNIKYRNQSINPQHKLFGTVSTIHLDQYLESIDQEWHTVPVIFHIFNNQIPACLQLDKYLVDLARKYTLAKFLRISASELDFDLVGSPALLAYQAGILVANLVRLTDEVGARFDVESVENVLIKHGALSDNDIYDHFSKHDSDEESDDYN